jgi:hypothetical protein
MVTRGSQGLCFCSDLRIYNVTCAHDLLISYPLDQSTANISQSPKIYTSNRQHHNQNKSELRQNHWIMSSFISLSTSSSSGFGIRSFTSTDHENGIKSSKRETKKELSSFISLSSSSSSSSSPTSTLGSYTSTIDGNGYKRFEKERKEFNNGRKWFSRLISPFVKQVGYYPFSCLTVERVEY